MQQNTGTVLSKVAMTSGQLNKRTFSISDCGVLDNFIIFFIIRTDNEVNNMNIQMFDQQHHGCH